MQLGAIDLSKYVTEEGLLGVVVVSCKHVVDVKKVRYAHAGSMLEICIGWYKTIDGFLGSCTPRPGSKPNSPENLGMHIFTLCQR